MINRWLELTRCRCGHYRALHLFSISKNSEWCYILDCDCTRFRWRRWLW